MSNDNAPPTPSPESPTQAMADFFMRAHVEAILERFPVLAAGGPEAREALLTVLEETVDSTKKMTRILISEEATLSLALLLQEDLNSLEREGLPVEAQAVLKEDPNEGAYRIAGSSYDLVLRALPLILSGVQVVGVSECDCEHHRAQRAAAAQPEAAKVQEAEFTEVPVIFTKERGQA